MNTDIGKLMQLGELTEEKITLWKNDLVIHNKLYNGNIESNYLEKVINEIIEHKKELAEWEEKGEEVFISFALLDVFQTELQALYKVDWYSK